MLPDSTTYHSLPQMKHKLLTVSTENQANIGDYIQALAAAKLLPSVDGFIQREQLKDYQGDHAKVIMNGWFMHHTNQWPPSENIHPLFVAFHLNSLAQQQMLNSEGIAYLKAHQPIGCRDYHTVRLLQERGIEAYFSGCLTLTLGGVIKREECSGKTYFVDPYFKTDWNVWSFLRNAATLLIHFRDIDHIARKHPEQKKGLRKRMILSAFYREYRRFFSRQTLIEAEYICQQSTYYKQAFGSDEERLQYAEQLVRKYADASLVVTSRIHCGLPCLGMGTPVILTEDARQSEASRCRMEGLRELFNRMEWNNGRLQPCFKLKHTITAETVPANKTTWKPLAERLRQTVCTWLTTE